MLGLPSYKLLLYLKNTWCLPTFAKWTWCLPTFAKCIPTRVTLQALPFMSPCKGLEEYIRCVSAIPVFRGFIWTCAATQTTEGLNLHGGLGRLDIDKIYGALHSSISRYHEIQIILANGRPSWVSSPLRRKLVAAHGTCKVPGPDVAWIEDWGLLSLIAFCKPGRAA